MPADWHVIELVVRELRQDPPAYGLCRSHFRHPPTVAEYEKRHRWLWRMSSNCNFPPPTADGWRPARELAHGVGFGARNRNELGEGIESRFPGHGDPITTTRIEMSPAGGNFWQRRAAGARWRTKVVLDWAAPCPPVQRIEFDGRKPPNLAKREKKNKSWNCCAGPAGPTSTTATKETSR